MTTTRIPAKAIIVSAVIGCFQTAWPIMARAGERRATSARSEAAELLERVLAPPRVAYSGEIWVDRYGDPRESGRVRVQAAFPGRFRREAAGPDGKSTRIAVTDGGAEWLYDPSRRRAWKSIPASPDDKRRGPEEELALTMKNYSLRVAEGGRVAGRPARRIDILELNGSSPVRQLWIDEDYGLLLQEKRYRPDGVLAGWMRFQEIKIPAEIDPSVFQFSPPEGTRISTAPIEPDYMDLPSAQASAGMVPRVPGWLPPGYLFESADVLERRGVPILHCRYSDGVDVLSVFQMPAKTRFTHQGAPRKTFRLGGRRARVFLEGDRKIVEWLADDQRLLLIGPLPVHLLRRVAESFQ
ncbi:MAG: hypothetical protein HY551_08280 [Elusimicrobia bacterium]|nr:hypothetical protein [Elusimicrobiota bacterium]